jgi:hypothetical protein
MMDKSNPSNPYGIVPLSRFVPRVFGFVHHSIALLYHEVPNLSITVRNFFIAVCRVGTNPHPPLSCAASLRTDTSPQREEARPRLTL